MDNRVPGGIALFEIKNYTAGMQGFYKGKRIAIYEHNNNHIALVGIPLNEKPGKKEITLKYNETSTKTLTFNVNSKSYKTQHLTIKNKRKVNPYEKDLPRIKKERIKKQRAKKTFTNSLPAVDFSWPTQGPISSIFGLRRFFNEQERRPHSGLDIAAPEGAHVLACSDGKVIESGDFFFSGNMIYLDHGQGIISLYAHLSRINVKTGDVIRKGQKIGEVGQTGRVTGPHLHFAVFANQTLVDPLFFLPELKKPGN